jgi:hypothetical protein
MKVIITGCFFKDVETFYVVDVDAFLLKINYLHNVLHVSEGIWMFGTDVVRIWM